MSETKIIRLRYWAAAKAAAGTAEDVIDVSGPTPLAALQRIALDLHPDPRLAQVLEACSVLVGEDPVGARSADEVLVRPGQTVEFLPPFAGG